MLCNLQVFATSEPSGHETTIHQCTDDTYDAQSEAEKVQVHADYFANKLLAARSGSLLPAESRPTTSATQATSTP